MGTQITHILGGFNIKPDGDSSQCQTKWITIEQVADIIEQEIKREGRKSIREALAEMAKAHGAKAVVVDTLSASIGADSDKSESDLVNELAAGKSPRGKSSMTQTPTPDLDERFWLLHEEIHLTRRSVETMIAMVDAKHRHQATAAEADTIIVDGKVTKTRNGVPERVLQVRLSHSGRWAIINADTKRIIAERNDVWPAIEILRTDMVQS